MKTKIRNLLRMLALVVSVTVVVVTAHGSADYGPAVWRPPCNANYYTTGYGKRFHVIHDMEGYYLSSISMYNSCSYTAAGMHYWINGKTDYSGDAAAGEVTQSILEANYAWHAVCWNRYSTGCEHEGFASNPAWFTPELYQASALLTRHLADKFGYAKDRNHIVGHGEGGSNPTWAAWAEANLGIDAHCNSHTDPGPYWDWGGYMARVQGSQNPPYYFDSNADGWTSGNSLSGIAWTGSSWLGSIYADQTGNDAYFYSPDTSYTGSADCSVNVCVYPQSGTTANHNMQMFYRTSEENSFTADKASPIVSYTLQNNWARINLDVNQAWPKYFNKTITGLRLDVDNSNSGTRWIINHVYVQASLRWRFEGDAQGWSSGGGLSGVVWQAGGWPGIIYADQTGTDPQFISPSGNMLGGINDTIHVRVYPQNGTTANHDMQVFFSTAGEPSFSESKSVKVFYTAKNAWADVYFDVGPNAKWNGDWIRQIRVDPDHVSQGNRWIIDSVAVEHSTSPTYIHAPTIGQQPAAQTANPGGTVTFSIYPNGPAPFTYQWQKNGVAISGATSMSLTLNNVQTGDAGNYACVASNSGGSATSSAAPLTVNVPPTITTQPQSQTVNAGASVTFSVAASGAAPLSYQWTFNGTNLVGATGSSFVKNNIQITDAGSYAAVVSNAAGSVGSAEAVLTVGNVPPVIATEPVSQTVNQGASPTFSVVATGSTPLFYQWMFNGEVISGATASSYTKSSAQPSDAGIYSVVVSNFMGSVTSLNATLTINVPPSISTQPQSQTVAAGAGVTFSVAATGTAPLSYRWTLNGSTIAGATGTSYTRSNLGISDQGSYAVVVTNVAGTVTSANAVLTVNAPPAITTQPASQTATLGGNATFTVTATGSPVLAYQWKFNNANISGATTSSYTKSGVQSSDVGYYSVVVTNSFGVANSSSAILTFSSALPFSESFESGALGNWTTCVSPATALSISTTQKHGGTYSATLSSSASRMYHNLGVGISGHAKFTFWCYDDTGASSNGGQTRWSGEARSYTGGSYNDGGVQQLLSIGRYGVGFGTGTGMFASETLNTSNYQGRVLAGANTGYFNLSGAGNRSVGWHKFEIEVLSSGTVNFYVDGTLGRSVPSVSLYPIDDLTMGSIGSGSTAGNAWFDDIKAEYYDAPSISTQPASQTVNSGSAVTFTAATSGTVTSYQWRKNSVSISGATEASLTLNNVQQADAASYSVVIANGIAPVTSAAAVLAVVDVAPMITTQPLSQTASLGGNVTFTVAAGGSTPMSYQWTFNGANVAGATTASLTKSNLQGSDAGSYAVIVSNPIGTATSAAATLSIGVPPTITTQPASQTVNPGAVVTFTAAATGTAPLSYQWTFNCSNISGATDTSYTRSNVQVTDAGSYAVVVSNPVGNITSANAVLSVNLPPAIATQPASQSVAKGANVTFTVTATGTAPLGYQWRFNGANLSGSTGSSLSKSNVQAADAGSYSVVVTNMAGSATSANAVLSVNSPPTVSLSSSRAVEQVVNFESITDYGNDHVLFRKPLNSSSTTNFVDSVATNYSMVVSAGIPAGNPNGNGSKALKVGWTFKTGTTNAWLRLTTASSAFIPNPVFSFDGRIRFDIYADKSILLALGLRETGGSVAVGGNGGTSGGIEWVGATGKTGTAPNCTRTISASTWTTVEVDLRAEPCYSFNAGNGVLEGTQGVLEHLAIVPNAGLTSYTLYLDNFQMVTTNTLPSTVTLNANASLTFNAGGTDPDAGQTLTYSLVSPPSGASINSSTGAFSWTPTSGGATNTITVQATDSGTPAQSNQQSFTAIIVNDPLAVQSLGGIVLGSDGPLKLTWPATPGGSYQLQYQQGDGEWINLGDPIVADTAEGAIGISGTSADQVSYRVIDLGVVVSDQ